MRINFIYLFATGICTLFVGCGSEIKNKGTYHTIPLVPENPMSAPYKNDTSALEHYLIEKKLINVLELDSTLRVVLHYATSHNFLHKPVYTGLTTCYLPCEIAIKLCNANYYLQHQFPEYHIIVFDAVRPLHIQKQMWDELDMPIEQKINYLAHPSDISLHNYGAAVDVGIIGANNIVLDMGTPFDSFNELSQPKKEQQFLQEGKLSQNAYANRLLLRKVMIHAGFIMMNTEWWHFNATNKVTAAAKFELIE